MKRILIIGAGDLGQQIAHYVSDSIEFKVMGYVDDWAVKGELRNDFPVLGKIDDIEELYDQSIFDELLMGIGYKHFGKRKDLFEKYRGKIPFATYIHPSCYVDNAAQIGQGVIILPRCVVDVQSIINDNAFIYSGTVIGHNSTIGFNSILSLSVTIGGFSCIGESCFIGLGSTIKDDVNIAHDVFIGSGSNVIESITRTGVYVGNPAKYLRDK